VPKNILILADGTGNESGLLPDESRTNVYKLFRATRTGPDTTIDPEKQIAFYVPGVGTPGLTPPSLRKRIWKAIEQAVGGGLTAQIVDCYAAIISVCLVRSMRGPHSGDHRHPNDRGQRPGAES